MIPRKARTKAKLKSRVICKKCFRLFFNTSKKISITCPNCGDVIDARDRSAYAKRYYEKYPEKAEQRKKKMQEYDTTHKRERGKLMRERVRKVVLNVVSNNNPVCENCGCDDVRLLEVNHKNGGGNKELKFGKNTNAFAWDIYMGRRKTDDLNLLCRVCNALHYLELKYGKTRHIITYK
jgi:predicted RNA-binding Zn-ribbon protein involved in translation (DUF1610 family)